MSRPSPEKIAEWRAKAEKKGAIVPDSWVVHATRKVEVVCGACLKKFDRSFVMNMNNPTFACPHCKQKNFVPITFRRDKPL